MFNRCVVVSWACVHVCHRSVTLLFETLGQKPSLVTGRLGSSCDWQTWQLALNGALNSSHYGAHYGFFYPYKSRASMTICYEFPDKGLQTCVHIHTQTNICEQSSFYVSFYSSSRMLIWKNKCSTQPAVFTSAAEGAQTASCTALTLLLFYFFVSPITFSVIIAVFSATNSPFPLSSSFILPLSFLKSPLISLSFFRLYLCPHLRSPRGPIKKM